MADATLNLLIIVPESEYFKGPVNSLSVVTQEGEITILPRHADYVSNVEISALTLRYNGHVKYFAIGGGAININQKNNEVDLCVNSIESVEKIDLARAERSKKLAEERLLNASKIADPEESLREQQKAEIRLKRALNRISVKNRYSDKVV